MNSRATGIYALIALAVLATLILVFSRTCCVEAVYPLERARQSFTRRILPRISGCFRGAAAQAENRMLRRQVATLSLLRGDIDRLEEENARLRRALEYTARKPKHWLPAGVLTHGGGAVGLRQTIRVDKGSLSGVKKGAIVVVPEGLVGRVQSVTPHTSEVILVSDPSVRVACEVESSSKVKMRGILSGENDGVLVLRHVTDATEIIPRARVLTSGLGGVFPRGLEVGTLLEVRSVEQGPSHEGVVLPLVDYSALEDVFINCEK